MLVTTRPNDALFVPVVLLALLLATAGAYQGGAKPLFDGKSFKGWEGNLSVFRIEDGAFTGGSLKESLAHNEFLCTTEEYDDFELRVKFKLLGDPASANAGVQFRSKRIPNHYEVIGYQADMGQQYWGALYDESRRRKILAGPNLDELNKVLKRDDWNDYLIHAEGKRVRLSINGFQTADYTETDDGVEQRGHVCLQIHGGPPSEAWYKEITIEPLAKKK